MVRLLLVWGLGIFSGGIEIGNENAYFYGSVVRDNVEHHGDVSRVLQGFKVLKIKMINEIPRSISLRVQQHVASPLAVGYSVVFMPYEWAIRVYVP